MPIIDNIGSTADFFNILQNNRGIVIFKFGAEWCAPCKKIEGHIYEWFSKMEEHPTIQIVCVDVDESFDVYGYLRTKKMIRGIPSLLAYYRGNVSYVFDECVNGTDTNEYNIFFHKILNHSVGN
jgi:thiol-disulfide isomerase/thioredoxin